MLSHVLHTLRSPRFQLTVLLSALSALVVAGPLAHSALTARSAQIGATNGSTTVTESPLPGDLIDAPGSVPEDPPLPEDGIDGSVALPSADDASKIVVDGLTELVAGPVVSEPNQPESTPRTPATGESTPAPTTQPTEDNSGETTPRPTTPAAVTASTGPGPEAPSLEGPDPFVSPTSTTALPRTSSTNVAKPQASTTLISASTTLPSTTAAPTTTTAPNDETGSGDTNGGANGSVGTTVPDAASESDTPTTTAAPSVPPSTVDMCSLDLPDSIETGDDCTILDLLPGLGEVELPPTTVAPPVSTPPTTDASATGAPTTTPVSPTTGSSTPATSTPEASTSPTGVASTDGLGIDVS